MCFLGNYFRKKKIKLCFYPKTQKKIELSWNCLVKNFFLRFWMKELSSLLRASGQSMSYFFNATHVEMLLPIDSTSKKGLSPRVNIESETQQISKHKLRYFQTEKHNRNAHMTSDFSSFIAQRSPKWNAARLLCHPIPPKSSNLKCPPWADLIKWSNAYTSWILKQKGSFT